MVSSRLHQPSPARSQRRRPTYAERTAYTVHHILQQRRQQKQRRSSISRKSYGGKNVVHRATIMAEVKKATLANGEEFTTHDQRLFTKAINDLVEDEVLQRVSAHGHVQFGQDIEHALLEQVPELPDYERDDPFAICKVIRGQTRNGTRTISQFPSGSPAVSRGKRRTSIGRLAIDPVTPTKTPVKSRPRTSFGAPSSNLRYKTKVELVAEVERLQCLLDQKSTFTPQRRVRYTLDNSPPEPARHAGSVVPDSHEDDSDSEAALDVDGDPDSSFDEQGAAPVSTRSSPVRSCRPLAGQGSLILEPSGSNDAPQPLGANSSLSSTLSKLNSPAVARPAALGRNASQVPHPTPDPSSRNPSPDGVGEIDFSYDFDDQQHDSQPTQDEIILQLTKDLEQYKELTDIMKEQRERDHQELSIANEQLEELDATRAKVDNLSRELENTRAIINAKDASITGLNADMDGLRTELQKVQDGLARAEEALLSAETRHADEVSELHTEVANLQAGNTEANELLVQLRAERDELNAFLIEADKVTASIRASLDGVSGDLELAKQEKAELAAQVENGRQAQTQILVESEAQGRRILDLEGELRVRDGLVNELQNSTIPSLKQKIVSLDSQLTTSQSIHRELATSISQYQTNLARSHQELDHARASCQLLHESLSSTNAQLIVLSKKINDVSNDNTNTRLLLEHAGRSVFALESQITSRDVQNTKLVLMHEALQASYTLSLRNLKDACANVSEKEGKLVELRETMEKRANEAAEELRRAMAEVETLKTQREKDAQILQQSLNTLNQLTAGLAMASGAAANLQNHMNSHTFA